MLIYDALEWVELPPGKTLLEENDYLFLTYEGYVYQEVDGTAIKRYGTHDCTQVLDMIGNLSLTKEMIDSKYNSRRKIKHPIPVALDGTEQLKSPYKLRAGRNGSLLLRINIEKLLEIGNEDKDLIRSVENLVSVRIQSRLIKSLDERQRMKPTNIAANIDSKEQGFNI